MADISITAIKAAYDALGLLNTATIAARATLVGLGARPTYPVDVVLDADYNDITTAIAAWDASYLTDSVAYNTAVAAQQTQELVTIALMRPNQWFKLTTLSNWSGAATQYIGIRNNKRSNANNTTGATLYYITTSSTLPAAPFPNIS